MPDYLTMKETSEITRDIVIAAMQLGMFKSNNAIADQNKDKITDFYQQVFSVVENPRPQQRTK